MQKAFITFILALAVAPCFSQQPHGVTYASVTLGYSPTTHKPIATLAIGRQFPDPFFAEVQLRPSLSGEVGKAAMDATQLPLNPCHAGIAAGYTFRLSKLRLSPLGGMLYRLVSTDQSGLNGWDFMYGGRVACGPAMAEYARLGSYDQFSIGLQIVIP